MLIVGIDEYQCVVSLEIVVQLSFGFLHALKRAEALQVRFSHVGDESAGGFGCLYQCLDVARMTGSHFHHRYLMLLVESEEGLGYTHVVIEVALRVERVVFLRQHRGYQFLCGGLPVGTCNANHRDIKLPTMFASQVLEGLQYVIYQDETLVLPIVGIVYHGVCASLLDGCCGKLVAVKRFAFQCEEDTPFGAVA